MSVYDVESLTSLANLITPYVSLILASKHKKEVSSIDLVTDFANLYSLPCYYWNRLTGVKRPVNVAMSDIVTSVELSANEELTKIKEMAKNSAESADRADLAALLSALSAAESAATALDLKNQTIDYLNTVKDDEATRIANENIRLANELERKNNESGRIDKENVRRTNEDVRILNENERINNENERKSLEITRLSNEALRITLELDREDTESIRNSNENTRKSLETTRLNNENTRKSNETTRLNNESNRQENEDERVSLENSRVLSETNRIEAENLREESEDIREANELNRQTKEAERQSKETVRINNENTRISNENTRKTQETNRLNKEAERQLAENTRISSEDERNTNETLRKANELVRIENENTRLSLEEARVATENIREDLETTRQNNEIIREQNETTRLNNENLRQQLETSRVSLEEIRVLTEAERVFAEETRVNNENTRISNENSRVLVESSRVTAESNRVTAELNRVSAEINRQNQFNTSIESANQATDRANDVASHLPYIGEDLYWYLYDETTKSYNKTTKYSKGDNFSVKATFSSVAEMESYINPDVETANNPKLKIGDFILIATDVELEDNAKLYVVSKVTSTKITFDYIADFSGARGFTGHTPLLSIGTVTTGAAGTSASVSLTEDGIDANGNPKYLINFTIPKGDQGIQGILGIQGIQGELGEKGDTGAAAGFGTPTASVDSNVGTPSVTITSSGDNTAKVFNFSFKNLKGEQGELGILGVQGVKGDKGDAFTYDDFTSELIATLLKPATDAATTANAAADKANTAATNANDKASLANTAALIANTAASNADEATADAEAATISANQAATNANNAASSANSAADNANNAVANLNWDNLKGKPSTFTPSAHNHAISEISDIEQASVAQARNIKVYHYSSITTASTGWYRIGRTSTGYDTPRGNVVFSINGLGNRNSPTTQIIEINFTWSLECIRNAIIHNTGPIKGVRYVVDNDSYSWIEIYTETLLYDYNIIVCPDYINNATANHLVEWYGGDLVAGTSTDNISKNITKWTYPITSEGGIILNSLTLYNPYNYTEPAYSIKSNRLVSGGGTSVFNLIKVLNLDDTVNCSISFYGNNRVLEYIYIGALDYNQNNLRIYNNGSISATSYSDLSDIRKKNIINNLKINISDIAEAPFFTYILKDDKNSILYAGTSAQYWESLFPNLFTKLLADGYYYLNTPNLAIGVGISIAKEFKEYKEQTDKKIEDLLNQINELKELINTLK